MAPCLVLVAWLAPLALAQWVLLAGLEAAPRRHRVRDRHQRHNRDRKALGLVVRREQGQVGAAPA